LILDGCVIRGNTAGRGPGGGIAVGNHGFLRLFNSTVADNSAVWGGGIYSAGKLWMLNSTVSGNTSSGNGSGIVLDGAVGSNGFIIRNSTISGNTAGANGGGLFINSFTPFPPA